jgi:hypothetical protein
MLIFLFPKDDPISSNSTSGERSFLEGVGCFESSGSKSDNKDLTAESR